jgi:predicted O-methyltransferase YrrM
VCRRGAGRLGDVVELRLGKALDTLPLLMEEGAGPFDLVFIDADKPSNPDCLRWALKLTRPGSVIVGDNVVGAVPSPAPRATTPASRRSVGSPNSSPRSPG